MIVRIVLIYMNKYKAPKGALYDICLHIFSRLCYRHLAAANLAVPTVSCYDRDSRKTDENIDDAGDDMLLTSEE